MNSSKAVSRTVTENRRRGNRKNQFFKNLFLVGLCFILTLTFGLTLKSMNASAKNIQTNDYKYFTVVKVEIGDTLTSIAKEYYDENHYNNLNELMKEIKYSNHITNSNELKEGQNLVVPYYSPEYHS